MKVKIPVQVIFREYFEGLLAAVGFALFLRFFILSVLYVPENHMAPELRKGEFVVSWKVAYGLKVPFSSGRRLNAKDPKRGDLISFRFPGDEDQILIRRIVGLPGESIEIKKGIVFVNGEPATYVESEEGVMIEAWSKSSYKIRPNPSVDFGPAKIPMGEYFVLTDDRESTDHSGRWGYLPMKNIQSRLGFVWLSLDTEGSDVAVRWDRMFRFIESSESE